MDTGHTASLKYDKNIAISSNDGDTWTSINGQGPAYAGQIKIKEVRMNLIYTANNTKDYGESIHKVVSTYSIGSNAKPEVLLNSYDYVIEADLNDDKTEKSFLDYVVDSSLMKVRVKSEYEQVIDKRFLKLEEIKIAHENAMTLGCPVTGIQGHEVFYVDCDFRDISNWTASLQMIEISNQLGIPMQEIPMQEITIRTKDNFSKTLTILEYKQMCAIVGLHFQSLFQKKWQLQEQINSSESLEELENIRW
jgi:hypothetical protein